MRTTLGIILVLAAAIPAAAQTAQEAPSDRVVVPLSDPAKPATVKADLITGSITVKSYEGKDVIVEARSRAGRSRRERPDEKTEGLRRLVVSGTGLSVVEDRNVVSVEASSHLRPVDLSIQVPVNTSLKLNTINAGEILVEKVRGEHEINNVNGRVTLNGISGSAVAHALNGGIKATFDSLSPGKTMSFSSLNGTIDVSFPPDMKANVVLKAEHGDVLTDFDIVVDPAAHKPTVEDARGKGGKYKVRIDRAVHGKINGGGPEIRFENFNGNIYIRKSVK